MRDDFVDDLDEFEDDGDLGIQPTPFEMAVGALLFCGTIFFSAALFMWAVRRFSGE
jgi:hypothetical protein